MCLVRIWGGGSRRWSPEEATQTPCHSTQVGPQVRILAVALAAVGSTVLWAGWGHLAWEEERACDHFDPQL